MFPAGEFNEKWQTGGKSHEKDQYSVGVGVFCRGGGRSGFRSTAPEGDEDRSDVYHAEWWTFFGVQGCRSRGRIPGWLLGSTVLPHGQAWDASAMGVR
ncbi:MAG TPA: hypothetical protein PLK35_02105, partial [Candidatus Moranbacteria bacterium]|nr:hypothetical protein [Candidatus Moranbacteria bacterium]